MERLIEIKQSELNPTLRALSDAGGTTDDAAWLRQGSNAASIIEFIHRSRGLYDKNPFEQTVEQQLAALREQSEAGQWKIPEEVFEKLLATAPAWPKGKEAYRSFRIRFGEGSEGVAKTFEAHAAAMKRVHGDKFWRWELLLSEPTPVNGKGKPVERLRLLNRNDTHHAVVEWVIIPDLSAFRKRESVTAVRGPKSLADEGIVLAWLFPDRVHAIDYDKLPAWFCGGYELNVPEDDDEGWQNVVCVSRSLVTGKSFLNASWRGDGNSGYSVPPLG
jgi:hypothetical protein